MLKKDKYIGTIARMWADNQPSYFADAYLDMFLYSQRYLCGPGEYIWRGKSPVSWHSMGRDYLVQEMQGEWLYQADTDHTFFPDALERLLRIANEGNFGVVSGIYQTKVPPHNPVLGLWNDAGTRVHPIYDWDRKAKVMPVGVVGGGCLLVKRWVFEKIMSHFGCSPFTLVSGLSEDYSFCWRCRELGIPIMVAPQVQFHHVIPTVLSVNDYVAPPGAVPVQGNITGGIEKEGLSNVTQGSNRVVEDRDNDAARRGSKVVVNGGIGGSRMECGNGGSAKGLGDGGTQTSSDVGAIQGLRTIPVVRRREQGYDLLCAFNHTEGHTVAVEVGPQRDYEREPKGWVPLNDKIKAEETR